MFWWNYKENGMGKDNFFLMKISFTSVVRMLVLFSVGLGSDF